MGVYASFSFRILTNVEAMNAVEALGNIIRHRRATIVVPLKNSSGNFGHELYTVPTISGEAIRHGYQLLLVKLAKARGIKVCRLCELGEFVKHGVPNLVNQLEPDLYSKLKEDSPLPDKELAVLETCAVEDIGGFLIPEPTQIKRTSRVEVSYMVPAIEDLKFSLDTQFHVRSAPQSQQAVGRGEYQPQSIYYIESASAVYTFTVNINLSEIGIVSNCVYKDGDKISIIDCASKALDPKERIRRIELSIDALAELIKNGLIGGHHSSYSPYWQPISAVALITKPIQTVVYPGHVRDFIKRTVELAEGNKKLLGELYDYYMVAYVDDKLDPGIDVGNAQRKGNIVEFFMDVKAKALEWVKAELGVK
ncbi:MAG: DevR family CRISPR-associated autoregulator [Vulcanisaeta sp.]